jgi:hypothetical protein
MQQLRFEAARFTLGWLAAPELPMIAAEALTRGVDSPALRIAAGLSRRDAVTEVFAEAMAELGILIGDQVAARHLIMGRTAQDILAAAVDPGQGAHAVYLDACSCCEHHHGTVMQEFLTLWHAWEEHLDTPANLTPQIRAAAVRLQSDLDALQA